MILACLGSFPCFRVIKSSYSFSKLKKCNLICFVLCIWSLFLFSVCGYSVIFFHMDSRLSQHLSVNRLFISHWIVMILCHSIRFLHALVCFYVPYFVLLLYFSDTAGKSLQACPTLCDPTDGSPLGFPVPGILQARTLEWVAISFSNAGKWKVKVKSLSHVWLFVTPWTAAYQAPPSMGFSRQEYWSGVPLISMCIKHSSCIDVS